MLVGGYKWFLDGCDGLQPVVYGCTGVFLAVGRRRLLHTGCYASVNSFRVCRCLLLVVSLSMVSCSW